MQIAEFRFDRFRCAVYACCWGLGFSLTNVVCADTSVWQVSSGDNTIYLGGTVHLLRSTDYPLPAEYEQAYEASSEIYFEIDMQSMNDPAMVMEMARQLTYSDGRSLKTVLNSEAYTALSEYAAGIGLPQMMLDPFKPGMVVTMLQLMEFQRIGFTPQGVDTYFDEKARADAKSLGYFETIDEQIALLVGMGEGYESEFILLSLENMEEIEELMDAMIVAWREGNKDALAELFVDKMKEEVPQLYDSMLRQRNLKWFPQIQQMLMDSDTEFVLVGAAHLVGEDGLLGLLISSGYQVKQL